MAATDEIVVGDVVIVVVDAAFVLTALFMANLLIFSLLCSHAHTELPMQAEREHRHRQLHLMKKRRMSPGSTLARLERSGRISKSEIKHTFVECRFINRLYASSHRSRRPDGCCCLSQPLRNSFGNMRERHARLISNTIIEMGGVAMPVSSIDHVQISTRAAVIAEL